MSVSQVGTPAAPQIASGVNGAQTVPGAWGTGQSRTAGHLLVAVVTAYGATSASAITETSGTWTQLIANNTATRAAAGVFVLTAAGSDTAPSFTCTTVGTASHNRVTCVLYELQDSSGATPSYDAVNGVGTANSNSGTTSLAPATAGNVPSSGCVAIAALVEGYSATSTVTFTRSSGWANTGNTGSTTTYAHSSFDYNSAPASGAAASDTIGGYSTNNGAAADVAWFEPPLPVAKSSADAATGTGIPSVRAAVSSADLARGKEAAYSFGGDWGTARESASVAQGSTGASSADTAHGAEGSSLHVTLAGTDTAHAAEGTARVRMAGTDSGHGLEAGSVHAALSKADSGHAAEGSPVTVRLSGADTAHGLEGSSLHASLTKADSGHAAEGSPVIRLTAADSAHAAEGAAIHATLAKADTAHGTEGIPAVRLAAADTAHAVEGSSLHVAVTSAEVAHGAEHAAPPGSPSGTDSGHAAEGSALHVSLASADTGHGLDVPLDRWISSADTAHAADVGSRSGAPQGADSAHAAEGSVLHATVPGADSAHAAEAAPVPGSPAGADTGHGAEGSGRVQAALVQGGTGHGLEAAGARGLVAEGDTGHAAEGSSLAENPAGSDSAHALEVGSVHAALNAADSAHAAEAGANGHTVHGADAGLATESAFYYISSADTGSAAEGPVPGIRVSSRDAGHAVEAPLNAWPSRADAGRGKDFPASAWPDGDDTARAAEADKPFRFAGADSAHVFEVLHEMGIWTYIPVGVRLLGKFWRVTGLDEDGNEVVIFEAERLTGQMLELAQEVNGPLETPPGPRPLPGVFGMAGDQPVAVPGSVPVLVPWSRGRRTARRVSSGDCATAAERVTREPVGVTCWVQPAVSVTVTVTAVAPQAVPGG